MSLRVINKTLNKFKSPIILTRSIIATKFNSFINKCNISRYTEFFNYCCHPMLIDNELKGGLFEKKNYDMVTIEILVDRETDNYNPVQINAIENATAKCMGDVALNPTHETIQRENDDEMQYLEHIKQIMTKGVKRSDRTGVGTYSIFGAQMRYSLRNDTLPLFTTKRVFWRAVVEELLWFIRGSTNANELRDKNVHIWDGNSSRAYLDKLGFTDRLEGDLGPVYGFQWRHFGAKYENMNSDYTNKGVDQLKEVINTLRTNPNDRRIIMCAWNPVDIPQMALPPCHCLVQFFVANGELSCQLYQRSADMGLGVPFNVASYSLLTHMIAHVTGLKAVDFVHSMGDSHVYLNHVDALKEQIQRKPRPFPKLKIKRQVREIDDFKVDDFELVGYDPYSKITMEMAV